MLTTLKNGDVRQEVLAGILALPRKEEPRCIKLNQAAITRYHYFLSQGLIRGIAFVEEKRIALVEFGSRKNPTQTQFGVCWFDQSIKVVHFAKCYLRDQPSWQLAAMVDALALKVDLPDGEHEATVYNTDPMVLGGKWQDISPQGATGFIRFVLIKQKETDIEKTAPGDLSDYVINCLTDAGVADSFVQDLIKLRQKRIQEYAKGA